MTNFNAQAHTSLTCLGITDDVKVDVQDFSIHAAVQIDSVFNEKFGGYTPAITLSEWNADLDALVLNGVNKAIEPFLTACPKDEDKSGLLCYPKCKENYSGLGPGIY